MISDISICREVSRCNDGRDFVANVTLKITQASFFTVAALAIVNFYLHHLLIVIGEESQHHHHYHHLHDHLHDYLHDHLHDRHHDQPHDHPQVLVGVGNLAKLGLSLVLPIVNPAAGDVGCGDDKLWSNSCLSIP